MNLLVSIKKWNISPSEVLWLGVGVSLNKTCWWWWWSSSSSKKCLNICLFSRNFIKGRICSVWSRISSFCRASLNWREDKRLCFWDLKETDCSDSKAIFFDFFLILIFLFLVDESGLGSRTCLSVLLLFAFLVTAFWPDFFFVFFFFLLYKQSNFTAWDVMHRSTLDL